MDDISKLNLRAQDLQLIQNVRLYLRVTILSEICNHKGTHLLQQYLHPPNLETPFHNIYPHPGSTLKWPTQPLPGPKAWKLWHKTLTTVYSQLVTAKLNQPLGAWIHDSYDSQWIWAWYICLHTNTLYQCIQGQWIAHHPMTIWRTYAICQVTHNNTYHQLPPNTTPVTP